MDNVTHSLIGVVLGEAIYRGQRRLRPPESMESSPQATVSDTALRAGILWAAVMGSNLPDFDLLLRPLVGGGIGYLLHHRGYTHTLGLALPLMAIAAFIGQLAAAGVTRARRPLSGAWGSIIFAGLLGVLCHIGADYWNDYGVHPFWPFENRWSYGDIVFILEPLIWLALLPFAYAVSRSRLGRGVCLFLGGAVLAAAWLGPFTTWVVALAITIWALIWTITQIRQRGAVWAAFTALLSVLVVFASASAVVRTKIRAALPPGETLLQLANSPAPSNPFCWRVTVTSREGDLYRGRMGVLGLPLWGEPGATLLSDPSRCVSGWMSGRTAQLVDVTAPSMQFKGMAWVGEFHGSIAELQRLKETHCRIRALQKFVRTPFWQPATQGLATIVGDLRYDREAGLGFAEISSLPGEECPDFIPPWDEPSGI